MSSLDELFPPDPDSEDEAPSLTTKIPVNVRALNPEQEAAVEAPVKGVTLLEAGAGCGKTLVLLERARKILRYRDQKYQRSSRILIVSFGKDIAAEMNHRLDKMLNESDRSRVDAWTAHGTALRMVRRYKYATKINQEAEINLLSTGDFTDLAMGWAMEFHNVQLETGQIKLLLGLQKTASELGITVEEAFDKMPDGSKRVLGLKEAAAVVWAQRLYDYRLNSGNLLFDDLLPLANALPTECFRGMNFKDMLADELQDLNKQQRLLVKNFMEHCEGFTGVGDACQPEDTPVAVPDGTRGHKLIPIGDLQEGDRVVSYSPRDCAFVQQGRRVNGITHRPYNGDLVVITTSTGVTSRYTPDHHCYATLEGLRDKHCVYVMRKGDQYRVGKAKMDYTSKGGSSASGPISRMRAEGADALWILNTYETHEEAFIMEQAISGRFGLPQLRFKDNLGTTSLTDEILADAWEFIGSNVDRGETCLVYFGRDSRFPLVQGSDPYVSLKRPMVIRACNLLEGARVLPYLGTHANKFQWVPVSVTREHYEGTVVSLDVEGEHLYVADGLVTHNCQSIFGFAGSDAKIFANMRRDYPHAQVLRLTTNYRCSEPILHIANQILAKDLRSSMQLQGTGRIDEAPTLYTNGALGLMDWIKTKEAAGVAWKDMAILYRTKTQAPELEMLLAQSGIPYVLTGDSFFEAPVVKDMLTYFHIMYSPSPDYLAWQRVCQHVFGPQAGVPVAKETFNQSKKPWEHLAALNPTLKTPKAREKWNRLVANLDVMKVEFMNPAAIAEGAENHLYEYWMALYGDDYKKVKERLEIAKSFTAWVASFPTGTGGFDVLEAIRRYGEANRQKDPDANAVRVMTAHKSKGQEFDHVAIWNVGMGTFPIAYQEPALAEEEHRLLYVTITRARKHVAAICQNEGMAQSVSLAGYFPNTKAIYADMTTLYTGKGVDEFDTTSL